MSITTPHGYPKAINRAFAPTETYFSGPDEDAFALALENEHDSKRAELRKLYSIDHRSDQRIMHARGQGKCTGCGFWMPLEDIGPGGSCESCATPLGEMEGDDTLLEGESKP